MLIKTTFLEEGYLSAKLDEPLFWPNPPISMFIDKSIFKLRGTKNPDKRNEKASGLQIPYWPTSNVIYQALEGMVLTKHGQQFAAQFTDILCR